MSEHRHEFFILQVGAVVPELCCDAALLFISEHCEEFNDKAEPCKYVEDGAQMAEMAS